MKTGEIREGAKLKTAEFPPSKVYQFTLTHCILVDPFPVICWTSPFVILGMLGLFCHFYSIFDGRSC